MLAKVKEYINMYTKKFMKEVSLVVRTTAKVLANGLMAVLIPVNGQIISRMEQAGRRSQAAMYTRVTSKMDCLKAKGPAH